MSRPASDSTCQALEGFGAFELLVTGDGNAKRLPLPENVELLIGRAVEADVRLESNSVSRKHARFRARGPSFSIEDLGSSNGTLVRGQAVAANVEVEIRPGESIVIGEFIVLLRPLRSRATPRHVWPRDYVEARIAEQAGRSRASGEPFFLLSIQVEGEPRVDPVTLVAAEISAFDVLGELAPGHWCVLLLDYAESEADELAARITSAMNQAGSRARVRVIGCPRDAIAASALMAELFRGPEPERPAGGDDRVVVRSPGMMALYEQLDAVASAGLNVLILGETGVGKDVLAKRIHERSSRRNKPFVRLNCAALAEPLLESELFGHEKGAFTGATHKNPGLLRSAEGGTVFLDEIGEFPQRLQPKLLQVLETREITSVGSVRPSAVDVRFVAATNRDLEAEALAKNFRSDLYYRLAGFTFVIPPLRERREDILPLCEEFLLRACRAQGLTSPRIDAAAGARLVEYAWPGNARELRNVMERALMLAGGKTIGVQHLPVETMRAVVLVDEAPDSKLLAEHHSAPPAADFTPAEQTERQRILEVLAECAGNQSKAADKLGISRSTLVNRLNLYRIRRPRKR